MLIRTILAAIMAVTLAAPTLGQAPVTYVDADSQAPLPTSTAFGDLTDPTSGNTSIDFNSFATNFWRVRDRGIGGNLYQFIGGTDGSDPQTLQTTIPGSSLSNGTEYNIYAFFWDDTSAPDWFVEASLNGGPFTSFSAGDAGSNPDIFEAANLPFANPVDVNTTSELVISEPGVDSIISLSPGLGNDQTRSDGATDNTDLFAARIGTFTANGSNVNVFIRNENAGNRVWYDGVGFQEVALTGDANRDGFVDINDYNQEIAPDLLTAQTPGQGGDVFGDGFVDLRDFSVWQQNRTDALAQSSVSTAVPEPNALVLLAVAAICSGVRCLRLAR